MNIFKIKRKQFFVKQKNPENYTQHKKTKKKQAFAKEHVVIEDKHAFFYFLVYLFLSFFFCVL